MDFRDHFVFGCFLSQNSSKLCKLGVFRNPQDLLFMMGTEFLKINAEMPEKIEVDAANPHLQIERMAKKCVCVFGANFNFNFLRHLCINFENLCAHQQEEILKIPKHPQKSTF